MTATSCARRWPASSTPTDDLTVVGPCGTLDELLALVEERQPDVVVTDIRMPPTGTDEGIQAAARIRASHPAIGVVVLSQYATPSYAIALLEAAPRAGPTS